jgi:glycosyltransferase involved in cell wall biosynthesis
MEEYKYAALPDQQPLKVILPGKMLSSKGIYDFVEVAKAIKNDKTVTQEVEFMLCGGIEEGHPFSAKRQEVESWHKQGWVNWAGFQKDMVAMYRMADIVILPSWREGMPKGLLEAGSVGRPIITYDVAGCSEVVEDGVSGYVVPFADVKQLTERTKQLINDRALRVKMGENSRAYMLRHFELYKIIEENIMLYNKFL